MAGEAHKGRLSVGSAVESSNSPARDVPSSPGSKLTSTSPVTEVKGDSDGKGGHQDGSISPGLFALVGCFLLTTAKL